MVQLEGPLGLPALGCAMASQTRTILCSHREVGLGKQKIGV